MWKELALSYLTLTIASSCHEGKSRHYHQVDAQALFIVSNCDTKQASLTYVWCSRQNSSMFSSIFGALLNDLLMFVN